MFTMTEENGNVSFRLFSDRRLVDRVAAGCTQYLTKPIDFDEFQAVLRKHLAVRTHPTEGAKRGNGVTE